MTFLRSWALFFLLAVPLAIAVSVVVTRRKRKYAVRYASLSLIREARPGRLRWRRHVPFALLLASLAALVLALARPETTVAVSRSSTSIILTLDVSRSMCSTDIAPNRLTVAENAAIAFVKAQPKGVRIGVIAFAGAPQLLVTPTTNTARLLQSLRSLTTAGGTAIGSAELGAIDALARVNPAIAPSTVDLGTKNPSKSAGYLPDIVVLLTDGDSNRGVDPLTAAGQAADRRVRVYTIGFGTDTSGPSVCSPEQIGAGGGGGFNGGFNGGFGGGGGGFGGAGGGVPRGSQGINETALKSIADITGAKYFRAQSAQQLQDVFKALPSRVQTSHETREISVIFVGLGALLATLAVGFSLWWNRYP